jgi:hypothetical protein
MAAYYLLTPCCNEPHPLYLKPGSEPSPLVDGVYNYSGPLDTVCFPVTQTEEVCLITGRCYKLEYTEDSPYDVSSWDTIPVANLTYTGDLNCSSEPTAECPCTSAPNPVYHVYQIQNCCGGSVIQVYTVVDEITEGVNVYNGDEGYINIPEGCYTVTEVQGPIIGPPSGSLVEASNFTQDPGIDCESLECTVYCDPCTCVRFKWVEKTQIGPDITISFYDCTKPEPQVVDVTLSKIRGISTEKVCFTQLITPPSPNWVVEEFGNCVLSNGEFDCPGCYRLEDCAGIADDIFSLDPNLSTYADTNQSITIVGSDVCWRVFSSAESCECAIATTLSGVFYNCQACNQRQSYKLTECTTGEIIYTTTDLSQYEFVYINIDCPGCWYVEPIDIIPPTTQPVTVTVGFESCEICNATFYILTDCLGVKDDIVTITDLSDYVGKVIKIKYCPDVCWEVAVTDPTTITGEVIFDTEYEGCPECFLTFTPQCVTFTNNSNTSDSVTYTDINANVVKVDIDGKGTTPKICALNWGVNTAVITVNIFGECVNGECPLPPQPKRKVTPGYNTATCSNDYYEKVECNFSEWMYKDALSKRYGITNCCPEELTKWLIKHEMLMLEVLVNPDYECSPTNTCGCPQPCDCGYISMTTTNTTCGN